MNERLKKKICFYGISTQLGGAERSLLDLVSNLSDEFSVTILLPSPKGPLLEALKAKGINVKILLMPEYFLKMSRGRPLSSLGFALLSLWSVPAYLRKLYLLFRSEKPGLVHSTGVKCHVFSALICPLLSIPVVWHIRDIFPAGITRFFLRTLAHRPQVHLVFNSQATQEAFSTKPLRKSAQFQVVYNGLPADIFYPKPNQKIRKELGIDSDVPLIASLGVLARWKGQLEFIEMAKRVLNSHPHVHFLIIGSKIYDTLADSHYVQLLHETVKSYRLERQIHFLGFRNDSAEILNSTSILVHTSIKPEPFGRVILEAMACGVPVIATEGGGVDEFVIPEKTGVRVAPKDVETLSHNVRRILDDARFRSQLISGGLDLFQKKFTLEKHVEEMQTIFRLIL
jgi:glycosyltransferase involved in cell wall biosynthesis